MVDRSPEYHMTREPDTCGRESDGRTVIARWILRHNEDGTRECATLYAMHFRGMYRAVVNRTQFQPDRGNGVSGELSAIMDTVEVLRRPTKRYSASALDAFATEAIAVINEPSNAQRFASKFDADIPA